MTTTTTKQTTTAATTAAFSSHHAAALGEYLVLVFEQNTQLKDTLLGTCVCVCVCMCTNMGTMNRSAEK